jgi:hypothetical protein
MPRKNMRISERREGAAEGGENQVEVGRGRRGERFDGELKDPFDRRVGARRRSPTACPNDRPTAEVAHRRVERRRARPSRRNPMSSCS